MVDVRTTTTSTITGGSRRPSRGRYPRRVAPGRHCRAVDIKGLRVAKGKQVDGPDALERVFGGGK
eukprot:scaffold267352_cov31-Prasinocladus_malaysianus.AAC.1